MHNLLKRQLKLHFDGLDSFPKEWQEFINTVNAAYMEADADRRMLERSLDLASQELLASNSAMRAVYERLIHSIAEGVFAFDGDLRYIVWNPAMERITGVHAEDTLGRRAFDVFPKLHGTGEALAFLDALGGKNTTLQDLRYHAPEDDHDSLFEGNYSPLRNERDEIIGGLGLLHDVTERKRAEMALSRRADEFAALYETTRELAGQSNLSVLLETIMQRATMLLGTAGGSVFLYDPTRGDLEIAVTKGPEFPIGTRFQMGEGMAGRVAQTRQPMIVDDYAAWEFRSTQFEGLSLSASMEVPMLYGGELIGVLAVNEVGPTPRKFTEADARLLSLFAAHAASAVHNARLLQETRRRAEQLALLYDSGLALNRVLEPRTQLEFLFQLAMRVLHADRAEFFRYDPSAQSLGFELGIGHPEHTKAALRAMVIAVSDENHVVARAGSTRGPVNVRDIQAEPHWISFGDDDIRSGIWVPVEHEDQLLGVLGILREGVHAFTADDERLLVLSANQAAVALENTRLFEERAHRVAELEAVNRISTALRLTQDIDAILSLVLDETLRVLNISAGSIWLYETAEDVLYLAQTRGWANQGNIRLKRGEALAGHVLLTGEAFVSREFKSDPHLPEAGRQQMPVGLGGLFVPIRSANEMIGVLSVSVQLPREIATSDIHFVATVAEIAGNAIHRARLFEQTEQRLRRLGALRSIDAAITSSLDLNMTLNVLLEQVLTQLRVDAADVLLLNPHMQTLEYAAGRGFRSRALQYTRLLLGEGQAGLAALERRIVHLPDLRKYADGLTSAPLLPGEEFVSYYAAPLIAKGQIKGVLEIFHRSPLDGETEWLDFLQTLAGQAAIAIDNATLFDGLQRTNVELSLAYDSTIEGWSRALDLRDHETEGHTQRVTEMTLRLARATGIGEAELVHIQRGALLHDIGKMGIPDSILLKPGPLTDDEWEIMRRHPLYAFELLSPIAYLRPALDIPYAHHEHWNGNGYPRKLKGEQIPLSARMFAIVDVWDALRSDRPYRKAWPEERVRKYIREQSGKHFDPKLIEAFLRLETTLPEK